MSDDACKDAAIKETLSKVKKKFQQEEKANDAKIKIKVYEKENKADLQREINKLARMIDARFELTTCIDCGRNFGKQIDAAHYHSRGAHPALRFHIDNLHSAASNCNQWSDKHKEGYKLGLVTRYGEAYANYVYRLPLDYPEIHLTAQDIAEKLKLVRKLIRDFNSFDFTGSLQARKQLNLLIGIYE